MTGLSYAGAPSEDVSTERRHGPGQRMANNTFREFTAVMVAKYGEAALSGMENFVKDPARREVSVLLRSATPCG